MSQSLRVVGFDPGFANLGLAALDLHQPAGATLHAVKLIVTQPKAKKLKTSQACDEERRLAIIVDDMIDFLDKWEPEILISEVRPFGRSARAVGLSALAFGAMFALARARGIIMTTISPMDIKQSLTGKRTASKEDVFAEIRRQFPDFKGWPKTKKFEHVADAAGAAVSARKLPIVFSLLGHKSARR